MSKDIYVCAVLSSKVLGTPLDSLTTWHCSPPRGRVGVEGRVSAVLAGSTRAGKGAHQANRLWEGQRGLWGDCGPRWDSQQHFKSSVKHHSTQRGIIVLVGNREKNLCSALYPNLTQCGTRKNSWAQK